MQLLRTFISALFACGLLLFSCDSLALGCVNWKTLHPEAFVPAQNTNGQLMPDYGLYWFKQSSDGKTEQVARACSATNRDACFKNLKANGFFDPTKPTIIIMHGWQPNMTQSFHRFDLCYQYTDGDGSSAKTYLYHTLQYWKGWNVAVFYWSQFADEPIPNVNAAEAKIYTTQGPTGMRWAYLQKQGTSYQLTYCSGQANCVMPRDANGKLQTITQMAYQAYANAFPSSMLAAKATQPDIRIAGESLGAQLAIQLTHMILTNHQLPAPTRLVLTDPFFDNDDTSKISDHLPNNMTVAAYNAQAVADIHKLDPRLPIAVYRTSKVSYAPYGNPNQALMDEAAYMRLFPKYITGLSGIELQAALHTSAVYLYLESKKAPPSGWSLDNNAKPASDAYVNADASNAEVLALMGLKRYQLPSLGETHFNDTQDDKFTNVAPSAELQAAAKKGGDLTSLQWLSMAYPATR